MKFAGKKNIFASLLICAIESCSLNQSSTIGTVSNPEVLITPISGTPTLVTGSTTGNKNYYYSLAVVSGLTYKIDLTNLNDNLDLFVFSDNVYSYSHLECSSRLTGTTNETCTVISPAGSTPELFIMIDNYAQISATYTLTITQVN